MLDGSHRIIARLKCLKHVTNEIHLSILIDRFGFECVCDLHDTVVLVKYSSTIGINMRAYYVES
jgi:hypothetical protein